MGWEVRKMGDNFEYVSDLQKLSEIRNFYDLVNAASNRNEREVVQLTYDLLSGKVLTDRLTEEQKYNISVCLLLWGFTWSSVEELLG